MNKEAFIRNLKDDVLQTDIEINEDTCLLDVDEWDSLSMIKALAFLKNNFEADVTIKNIQEINTVADLMTIVGVE